MHIHDLPTPALLLDVDILEHNLLRMQERANRFGVSLRPHIKTHKCLSIAERQRALGARGITVSTLYEAERFADAGFNDITWALPVPFASLDRALRLAPRTILRFTVDSFDAVSELERRARRLGISLHVWLKVDCGSHRAGIDPRETGSIGLARTISDSSSLVLDGILTHAGHSYNASSVEEIQAIAEEERAVMAHFASTLRSNGIVVPSVSVGSTPTMTFARDLSGVSEIRPGNYCFHDLTMVSLGVCAVADCAVTVLASAISTHPGMVLTDAGALALSKDLGATHRGNSSGLGLVFRDYTAHDLYSPNDMRVIGVSQEHGKVSVAGTSPFRIGDRMRILEQHSCLTAAMFDSYAVVRGDDVVDRWEILRGRI